jgi:GT2 family glycosyltransferase
MAFRKEMFKKYGGFRTDLGPSPNREVPRPNEDTELGRRFMAAGERIRYEPKAIVYHPVPDGRIRKDYFLSWYFDYGRANVREWPKGPDILGIPRRFLTLLKIGGVVLPTRIVMWAFAPGARRRFFRKCWVWMTAGEVKELYRELRS